MLNINPGSRKITTSVTLDLEALNAFIALATLQARGNRSELLRDWIQRESRAAGLSFFAETATETAQNPEATAVVAA